VFSSLVLLSCCTLLRIETCYSCTWSSDEEKILKKEQLLDGLMWQLCSNMILRSQNCNLFQNKYKLVFQTELKSDDDDDIYLAKKPGYQKGHKPINAGCPYKKIL